MRLFNCDCSSIALHIYPRNHSVFMKQLNCHFSFAFCKQRFFYPCRSAHVLKKIRHLLFLHGGECGRHQFLYFCQGQFDAVHACILRADKGICSAFLRHLLCLLHCFWGKTGPFQGILESLRMGHDRYVFHVFPIEIVQQPLRVLNFASETLATRHAAVKHSWGGFTVLVIAG